ncbi:MAG TPA: GNAT family N-acetyltransferase, partial [Arenicellales bacterium]|nr:GNAT family N-acetyltransferase [Arenicellales bacterium]
MSSRADMTPRGVVRRLGHHARGELAAHLLRLSPCQRRMRFNGGVSDEFVHTYCRGFCGTRSLVLGFFLDGVMRGAGELMLLSDIADSRSCEIAVSVEHQYQGLGIGTGLVRRLLVLAANRRIRTMHVLYTRDNRRMENIALRFGAGLTTDGTQIDAVISVAAPTDHSLFEEALFNG